MHVAFDAKDIGAVPVLYRPRAEQFIQLFDAHLIPEPSLESSGEAKGAS